MYDVAIAGAGVGGATLALLLARSGFQVVVAEQARAFPAVYRGEFLQPRTLELFRDLGLLPELEAVTTPVHSVLLRTAGGRLYGEVDYRRLPGPQTEGRNGLHREIQGVILRALAAEPGVTVKMGCRVTGLLRERRNRVSGLATTQGDLPARLTVGADGQQSVVRRHLQLPTTGFRYPGVPLGVTVDLDEPPPPQVEFVFGRGVSALMFPLPGRAARLYLVAGEDWFTRIRLAPDRGLAAMQERLSELLPRYAAGIARIPDMGAVQRVPCNYLRAHRWTADGAAILGDAAHAVSPTRGQGMNLAIHDAAALAGLLARLNRDRPPLAADLRPYERLRQRSANFIQNDADRVHRLLLAEHPAALWARDLWFGMIPRAPETMSTILGMYSGHLRPPRWYDYLIATTAVAVPGADRLVAQIWRPMVSPLRLNP